MNVWFFSDLHLARGPFYQEFVLFLSTQVRPKDRIVFAGDIFDLFVGGSDYFKDEYREFFQVVQKLDSQMVRIDYLFGNHDFHLESAFSGSSVQFHSDSLVVEVLGASGPRRIWVEHGDLVDRRDWKYLNLRKIFRSSWMKWLVPRLPLAVILFLAQALGRKHDQQVSELPESWNESQRERLRGLYRSHAQSIRSQGFDWVIMGHCHDLDSLEPFYFNMGYPPVHRQFLVWRSESELIERGNFPGIPAKN